MERVIPVIHSLFAAFNGTEAVRPVADVLLCNIKFNILCHKIMTKREHYRFTLYLAEVERSDISVSVDRGVVT